MTTVQTFSMLVSVLPQIHHCRRQARDAGARSPLVLVLDLTDARARAIADKMFTPANRARLEARLLQLGPAPIAVWPVPSWHAVDLLSPEFRDVSVSLLEAIGSSQADLVVVVTGDEAGIYVVPEAEATAPTTIEASTN